MKTSGLLFPAINELRCSVSHIAIAFIQEVFESQKESYDQAIRHCKRASYEALDALLQYYLTECRNFQNDYRTVQIETTPEDYQKDYLYLNSLKTAVPSRQDFELAEYNEKFEEILNRVANIFRKLDTARPELNKKLKKENQNRFYAFLGILFSGIAIGISLIKLLL